MTTSIGDWIGAGDIDVGNANSVTVFVQAGVIVGAYRLLAEGAGEIGPGRIFPISQT